MNKLLIILSILIFSTVGFIIGDYLTLFGVKETEVLGFIDISFKPIEEDTGAMVPEVKVRCFQKNNGNACTQRDSNKIGIVSIRIPVFKRVIRSRLFIKEEAMKASLDPKLHIMFIHYNYHNPVKSFIIKELYHTPVQNYLIKMSKRFE